MEFTPDLQTTSYGRTEARCLQRATKLLKISPKESLYDTRRSWLEHILAPTTKFAAVRLSPSSSPPPLHFLSAEPY